MSGGELSWLGGSAVPSAGGTPKNGLAWQLNAADATEGERRARPVGRGVVERVFQPPQALGQPASIEGERFFPGLGLVQRP